jgi:uncharacterized protein RhaS with RHS repeats
MDRSCRRCDPLDHGPTTVYDAYGREWVTVDQLGGRTTMVYNNLGQLWAIIDPVGNRTTYLYDVMAASSSRWR